MPVIEANGYRFDSETGDLTGDEIFMWRPSEPGLLDDVTTFVPLQGTQALIAAAITATRAEPIEVRYRWEAWRSPNRMKVLRAIGVDFAKTVWVKEANCCSATMRGNTATNFDTEAEAREWLLDQTQDRLSALLRKPVVMVEEC